MSSFRPCQSKIVLGTDSHVKQPRCSHSRPDTRRQRQQARPWLLMLGQQSQNVFFSESDRPVHTHDRQPTGLGHLGDFADANVQPARHVRLAHQLRHEIHRLRLINLQHDVLAIHSRPVRSACQRDRLLGGPAMVRRRPGIAERNRACDDFSPRRGDPARASPAADTDGRERRLNPRGDAGRDDPRLARRQLDQPSQSGDLHERLLRLVEPPLLQTVLQRHRGHSSPLPSSWACTARR